MPDDDQNDQVDDNNPNWRRELEAKARRADELAVEVEQLKKDSVFNAALAGVDHPGLGYFKDGYKGELTPEAIRQAAVEAGFAATTTASDPPTQSTATPPPTVPDLAAHQRMSAAAVGAAPPPPFDPVDAIAKAKSPDEVMAIIEAHGEKYGVISSRLAQ